MPTPAPTYILGISAFYHDSAACLLRDGEIVAASSEDRFTRVKADASFPRHAVDFCLARAGIGVGELACVGFYDKPLLKFERILETYLGVVPRGFPSFLRAGPLWMKEKLFTDRLIREALGYDGPLLYARHHESHAASAFFPSPFEEAAILTVDGVGEWATSSIGVGRGHEIELFQEMRWPDSLGLLYSAATYHTGFRVNSGEYKVMGLAPLGRPRFVDAILDRVVDLKEDGSFTLDQRYFSYLTGLTMTSPTFDELVGGPPRRPESAITQRELDLARSVQDICEEIMLRMARTARRVTGLDDLCLAGGVALNAVANGRILREGPFRRVWIQPAAGDAGGSLGVARLIWHRHLGRPRTLAGDRDGMRGALLGPDYSDDEAAARLSALGARFDRLPRTELNHRVAAALAAQEVVGWFNGRAEFGPRALGSRSILADPRDPGMQAKLNLKIKFRESFRPFAPSVLRERFADYFELDTDSPYMLLVARVKEGRRTPPAEGRTDPARPARSNDGQPIPAVTHVDHSARVQTVDRRTNPDFHALIAAFERLTGCPVLVNTSFNVRGEPIVGTPEDAYRCFMKTDMDLLVVGSLLMRKADQPAAGARSSPGGRPVDGPQARLTPAEGRSFALPVATVLLLFAALVWWRGDDRMAFAIAAAGTLLLLAGLAIPEALGPVHRGWMRFALLLSRITTPIFLALVYFPVMVPTGLLIRLFGRNPLARTAADGSYWVRIPEGAERRGNLERQF